MYVLFNSFFPCKLVFVRHFVGSRSLPSPKLPALRLETLAKLRNFGDNQ